jgi:hypothetical protein
LLSIEAHLAQPGGDENDACSDRGLAAMLNQHDVTALGLNWTHQTLSFLQEYRACGDGSFGEGGIEPGPGKCLSPWQREPQSTARESHLKLLERISTEVTHKIAQSHRLKRLERSYVQTGPTDFPAGKTLLFHKQSACPKAC